MGSIRGRMQEGAKPFTQIAGVGLPIDRSLLLLWFRLGAVAYFIYFYFSVHVASVEIFVALLVLAFLSLVPAYLWCAGKAHGLPIVPVFALGMFPAYILPIQTDSKVLVGYDTQLQLKAILCACALVFIMTVIWHQMCNRISLGSPKCRMMSPAANWLLMVFMISGLLFQVLGLIFFKYNSGLFTMVRGYTSNGATLALFLFCFQFGEGRLAKPLQWMMFGVVAAQIIVDSTSFILAGTLVKLGTIFVGYSLGSQKIPWKAGLAALGILLVLHAGKADMRQAYWREGSGDVSFSFAEYPVILAEWVQAGLSTLQTGKTKSSDEQAAASERAAMVPVFLRVLSMTPGKVPYLDGATYKPIPSLLVPRILNKEKGVAHIGNWMMGYLYEYVGLDQLGSTSIGFDLMIESYANYGIPGVLGLAMILGFFYGWVAIISNGVPLLSFRFLFAVSVLTGTLASNNTAGVFVTTLWQGFLALCTFSLVAMKTLPNPLYFKPGGPRALGAGAPRSEGGRPDSKTNNSDTEAPPVRHERPTRFVYGKGKQS